MDKETKPTTAFAAEAGAVAGGAGGAGAASARSVKKENKVIIRVWLSKTPDGRPSGAVAAALGGGNVGHASIEVNNNYFSFWPSESVGEHGVLKCIPPAFNHLHGDLISEGGEPDRIICLYSLDPDQIMKKFQEYLAADVSYIFISGTWKGGKAKENCCSMAYQLLKAGGIDRLIPKKLSSASSSDSSLLTPLRIFEMAQSAKLKEIKDFSESRTFEGIAGEYIPTEAEVKASDDKGCVIF